MDDEGRVHLFWIHEPADREPRAGSSLYVSTAESLSADSGPARELHDTICECCRLSPATGPDGAPVVMTRFVYDGTIRDMGLAHTAFEDEPVIRRVTVDDWQINACPEHGPSLSIANDGRYHFTWFTQGKLRKGTFYAYSDDAGLTHSEPLRLGNPAALPGNADVLAIDERVVVTWREFDGEQSGIFTMASSDAGETWAAPTLLAESPEAADYPFVLSHGGIFYISWYAHDLGHRLFPVRF